MTSTSSLPSFEVVPAVSPPTDPGLEGAYEEAIAELSGFLDALAGAQVDSERISSLGADLRRWKELLLTSQVGERERQWGHWFDTPSRGQALGPLTHISVDEGNKFTATVRFTRFHVGENGAVHGGAVALLFDEILGRMALQAGPRPSRTASLTVDFRNVTPINEDLTVVATLDQVDGRKRFVSAELHHGDTLCAEATALCVELKPGAP